MNRRLVTGFVLMGIGLSVTLVVIMMVQELQRSIDDCLEELNQPCRFIGSIEMLMFIAVFTVGLPMAGVIIVISSFKKAHLAH